MAFSVMILCDIYCNWCSLVVTSVWYLFQAVLATENVQLQGFSQDKGTMEDLLMIQSQLPHEGVKTSPAQVKVKVCTEIP